MYLFTLYNPCDTLSNDQTLQLIRSWEHFSLFGAPFLTCCLSIFNRSFIWWPASWHHRHRFTSSPLGFLCTLSVCTCMRRVTFWWRLHWADADPQSVIFPRLGNSAEPLLRNIDQCKWSAYILHGVDHIHCGLREIFFVEYDKSTMKWLWMEQVGFFQP